MANPSQVGSFVATSNIWDVGEIQTLEGASPQLKELLVRLYQNLNNMSLSINTRDAGYYDQSEFVNGQLWFPKPGLSSQTSPFQNPSYRQVFRRTYNVGPLPNNATKLIPHNLAINSGWTFTRIYGAASDTTGLTYIPLPYVRSDLTPLQIELEVTSTDIEIDTAGNYSNYNIAYVVLEYLKS